MFSLLSLFSVAAAPPPPPIVPLPLPLETDEQHHLQEASKQIQIIQFERVFQFVEETSKNCFDSFSNILVNNHEFYSELLSLRGDDVDNNNNKENNNNQDDVTGNNNNDNITNKNKPPPPKSISLKVVVS